ncbi:MAG TPA: LysE family transporter [Pseudomonadales bacterium]|nr:LysE family transporter [Pseudomonadales bacterium]
MVELLFALLGLGAAQTLAVMSPGPSFLVVARTALSISPRTALWTTVGLGLGTLLWSAAALFGLTVLFAQLPWLYAGVRLLGALYLLWLAVMLWRHAATPLALTTSTEPARAARLTALRSGLLTQLANPKVAVFFGSIFVTFLPADPSPSFLLVALALTFVIEVAWYGTVSIALSHRRLREGYMRMKSTIDRITGTVLAGLGLRLALAP